MPSELTEILDEFMIGEEDLPPECLLDKYHPQNHQFYEDLTHIKRQLLATGNKVKPYQREAVRLHRAGMSNTDIGKKLDIGPTTIAKWLKLPECKRLNALMNHLQMLNDGPNQDHRKNILYRIAVDNTEKKPRVTIAAIQEINRMSGTYGAEGGNSGNVVQIQINGELLPRGSLDTMPETYENRQLQTIEPSPLDK